MAPVTMKDKWALSQQAAAAMKGEQVKPFMDAIARELQLIVPRAVNTQKLWYYISALAQGTAQTCIAQERGLDIKEFMLTPEEQEAEMERLNLVQGFEGMFSQRGAGAMPPEMSALLEALLGGDGHAPDCDCDKEPPPGEQQ